MTEKAVVNYNDEILPANNDNMLYVEKTDQDMEGIRRKVTDIYGLDQGASSSEIDFILSKITVMTEDEALNILVKAIEYHDDDPNFPGPVMQKIKLLVQGPKVFGADTSIDYEIDLKVEAALIHYHSPYPEVRAVSDPEDDPTAPVETIRSYFLGMVIMGGATSINTFFSPRQPAINLGVYVLQLLLAPCGWFLAKVLPDWGFTFRGKRHSLNPGPWTYKEQLFATIIFSVANGPGGTYYIYLVQQLPQYLGNTWVTYGYEVVVALSVQYFGFGFAGLLRRFVIYPVRTFWPKTFPTLALNRALLVPEKKENIHGWTISKYRFFMLGFAAMFCYFWIPNFLFGALHSFNWMTWIAPNNFTLAMITGSYGGMGFNPIATFDWNYSGSGALVTPFYSTVQQYCARVISGLIIIGMYWGNMYWSAYMPINSAEAFANDGTLYNVSKILTNGVMDVDKYKQYSPPFFSGANVFGQGAWFAIYTLTLSYVTVSQWSTVKGAFSGLYRGIRYRESFDVTDNDAHSRMMAKYKEAPDWWFLIILLLSLTLGIIGLKVWPTETPFWSLFAIIGMSAVFIVPSAVMLAVANVGIGFNVLFQLLAGVWYAGNPEAQIIVTAFGQNFDSQTETYLSNNKLAHYAKLPPRAIFRGQMFAVLFNCFIFIGLLQWMVSVNQSDNLCTYSNKNHMVCQSAVELFASAIEYGAFSVPNMFELYPILPWCFLFGAIAGSAVALAQKYAYKVRDYSYRRFSEATFETLDRTVFRFFSFFKTFSPPVFWAGSLNWTNGNNLTYATNALYISFIFMYHIKRRYPAWFEKYNYVLECAFDAGVAISGLIQTLAFAFLAKSVSINWWGNSVSTQGADFRAYNQNGTLLPIPEVGYFGPSPENYPMKW